MTFRVKDAEMLPPLLRSLKFEVASDLAALGLQRRASGLYFLLTRV